jgi:large subunit ribosomal protein L9
VEVILLEKMRHLGVLGDKVKVKPGFARNYLIPYGKAVYANVANTARFEAHRAELEKRAAEKQQQALLKQQQIQALSTIRIMAKAGEEGKLFGSIGARDIAEALVKVGIEIEKRDVRIPTGTLRLVGEYEIVIELEGDITATAKVSVVPASS